MKAVIMKYKIASSFFITLFYVQAFSQPLPPSQVDPACRLDFSAYPYQPTGGCTSVEETDKNWNSFPKTSCCQNALKVLSHALALHARNDALGSIFIPENQWKNCSNPFELQPGVSLETCGFDNFFNGNGNGNCSLLQLSNIFAENQDVIYQCSLFNSSLFDDACGNCTTAISNARDAMSAQGNETEKATCLLALIVSVIARNMNNTSIVNDFDRCLPALAVPVPEAGNYFKLNYTLAETIFAIVLVIIGLTFIIMLINCGMKSGNQKKKPVQTTDITSELSGLYRFSKTEINNALHYGGEKKYLGRGSAGQVYRGMLPSGQLVAIKQIYKGNKSNTSDSFYREIDGLSRVRHPNLVCLFGCCIENGDQYLVYEYCSAGNLAQNVLRKDTVLTWDRRVKILRDCAFALKYLHNHIDGCIVHRDIKLTNILLTEKFVPKLSDFGLAKMLGMDETKVFTDVRGTIGYMDPEYMSNAKLTCASDIYSFGIVILQLLSGQRVIELDLEARDQLTRKAKDVNMGKRPLTDFQDPRLKGSANTLDFEAILQIAVLCVASSSRGRPTIDLVFDELDKAWRNTEAGKKAKERHSPASIPSKSPELIHV
ncbi:probable leucine-rich repeat receptor-like protein kinase At5g49770 [Olea europaea var. sylvestris]|uniref:probable leucine-rich repeat receptor-like protein kinase At5g49770 n=1 Tax=Olea europaea var. sylvestris TaxID=158386 RepID=UPI000C1CEB16|nr:probable leucine-rich repeat receptor-like protein kinase At5g49770 [Olea europaea var. sylvestris]XP_022893070.1 probable leucine-rich repeat receptor-like protein kinase At5g49770 [Olea europaea var. sylvestris]